MRADPTFDAAARAVLHCEDLLARPAPEAEAASAFAGFAGSVAAALAPRLAGLLGQDLAGFSVTEPETMFPSALAARLQKPAGNLVLPVGERGNRLFASFALRPLAGQLNRLFGGEPGHGQGEAMPDLKVVPASLLLLLRRLDALLVEAMADCLDGAMVDRGQPARLDTDFAAMAPFPQHALISLLELRFPTGSEDELNLLLACRKSALERLLGHWRKDGQAKAVPRRKLTAAMADVEIALHARLVDMAVPASRLARLAPGEVLPVALARSVPLFAGDRKIGSGVVGELDDRVALQLEEVDLRGETA